MNICTFNLVDLARSEKWSYSPVFKQVYMLYVFMHIYVRIYTFRLVDLAGSESGVIVQSLIRFLYVVCMLLCIYIYTLITIISLLESNFTLVIVS